MKRIITFIMLFALFLTSCSNVDSSSSISAVSSDMEESSYSTSTTLDTTTSDTDVTEDTKTSSISSTAVEKTTNATTTTTKKTSANTTKAVTTTTTSTTPTSTTPTETTTTHTEQPQDNELLLSIPKVKSHYYSTATSFACIESILNYFGYNANQDEMIKYLKTDTEMYEKNGKLYTNDPTLYFIGDPKKKGQIGSTEGPIYFAIKDYFSDNNINLEILAAPSELIFWGIESSILDNELTIAWISNDINQLSHYYLKNEDEEVVVIMPGDMTCMIIIGIDDEFVKLYDPLTDKVIKMSEEEYAKRACHYSITFYK